MTPQLRKMHRQAWNVLIVVLPLFVVVAGSIRTKSVNREQQGNEVTNYVYKNEIGKSPEISIYEVMTVDSTKQIGIEVYTDFQSASAIAILESGSKDMVLGKISHKGLNVFPIADFDIHNKNVRIEDVIKKTNLAELKTE